MNETKHFYLVNLSNEHYGSDNFIAHTDKFSDDNLMVESIMTKSDNLEDQHFKVRLNSYKGKKLAPIYEACYTTVISMTKPVYLNEIDPKNGSVHLTDNEINRLIPVLKDNWEKLIRMTNGEYYSELYGTRSIPLDLPIPDYSLLNSYKNKKYELVLDDYKIYNAQKVYRIRSLKDFDNVKKGDLGGYVKSESNLSHNGNCWIYNKAIASDKSLIINDAKIYNKIILEDSVLVTGDASIKGNMRITGSSIIVH